MVAIDVYLAIGRVFKEPPLNIVIQPVAPVVTSEDSNP